MMCAATLASPAATAGVTGNVGAVSEYLFRGIEQSGGAAVQGGIDWTGGPGVYLGTWASNTGGPASSGGTELDLYGGWAGKAGPVTLDFGAIYYLFTEDEEDTGFKFDYPEVYAKVGISVVQLQVYYTNQYLGDALETFADSINRDTDFIYANLLANIPLSETLTLGLQVGNSSGDGAELAWDDAGADGYTDYSVSLTKALDAGLSFTFGLYDTTLEINDGFGTMPGDDDSFKAVAGLKKTFEM